MSPLNCIFTLESSPVSFQTCSAVPLLAVGAGGVQVKGSCFPAVWSPQGVCAGPCSTPPAPLTIPPGWDGTGGTLLHGAAPKHISVNPLRRHPWAAWEWGWVWDRRDNRNLSHELGCQDWAASKA